MDKETILFWVDFASLEEYLVAGYEIVCIDGDLIHALWGNVVAWET
jgi:hypothetical protein